MDLNGFKVFIAKSMWQTAKTARDNPHQYTLRKWCIDEEFADAVKFIDATGKPENYFRQIYICTYVGGYKYWTMGLGPDGSTLINRGIPGTSKYDQQMKLNEV